MREAVFELMFEYMTYLQVVPFGAERYGETYLELIFKVIIK